MEAKCRRSWSVEVCRSTGRRAQPCVIWEFALFTQLLIISSGTPGWLSRARFHPTCHQKKGRVFVASSVCPIERQRFQLSLLQERCIVSPLLLFCLILPINDTDFAHQCTCKVHGGKEKLNAELLLKAHRKKDVTAVAEFLTVTSNRAKDCLLIP